MFGIKFESTLSVFNLKKIIMKKITLLAIALFVASAVTSFAQTTKGTVYIGGGLGFSAQGSKIKTSGSTTDGDKANTFFVTPGVGFFVADKISVGLDLDYINYTSKEPDSGPKTKNNSFGVTPYARYHWMLGDNFGFTGTFAVGIQGGTTKVEDGGTTTTTEKTSGLNVGITPGIVFFPNNKIGLEAGFGFFGYSSSTNKDPDDSSNKTVYSNIGLGANTLRPALSFALRYYFTK